MGATMIEDVESWLRKNDLALYADGTSIREARKQASKDLGRKISTEALRHARYTIGSMWCGKKRKLSLAVRTLHWKKWESMLVWARRADLRDDETPESLCRRMQGEIRGVRPTVPMAAEVLNLIRANQKANS